MSYGAMMLIFRDEYNDHNNFSFLNKLRRYNGFELSSSPSTPIITQL